MTPAKGAAEVLELRDKTPSAEPDALVDVRAQVQADAQDQPEEYLADTIAAGGGE